jgi:hypothetical protein
VHYCVLILLRVIQKPSLGISNILSPFNANEDGGLESAIRCDRVRVYFYHGILTNKVIGIGLICLITTSI